MKLTAKVLIDNISDGDVKGEWGFSIYIVYGQQKILLDVGASDLFADNAMQYGINLKEVDYAVLSHAHYDHANGMKKFFALNDTAPFYMQQSKPCYAKKYLFYKYIGIPKHITKQYADRIRVLEGDYKLCEGVYLVAHHTDGLAAIGKREKMYQRTPKGWKPDDFSHEQSLVFDTQKGLIIFNSCSHGGAANIIQEVANAFPDKKVYGLIGGFHLYNKTCKEVEEVAARIKETGISYVCTGHCTSHKAYRILQEALGEKMHQLHVGMEMEF